MNSEQARQLARRYCVQGRIKMQYAANSLAACIENEGIESRNSKYYLDYLKANDSSLGK